MKYIIFGGEFYLKVFKLVQDFLDFKTGYIISNGKLGALPWGWELPEFIMVRNPEWFEDVSIEYMDKDQQLKEIRKHFNNLHEVYLWIKLHSEDGKVFQTEEDTKFYNDNLEPAIEKEIAVLKELGVSDTLSRSLVIFGSEVTEELMGQFNDYPGKGIDQAAQKVLVEGTV